MMKINFLDLIFPPVCMMCNKTLGHSNKTLALCENCIEKIFNYEIASDDKVPEFLEYVDKFYSVYQYKDEVRDMFLKYKFQGEIWRGKFLGRLMFDYLDRNNAFENIDLISYVPVNDNNLAKRGYDQTQEIVLEISKLSNIFFIDCLKKDDKIKDNAADKKSRVDRLNESKYVFVKGDYSIMNRNVLLIDDILTTGATMNECSSLIMQNGAKSIVAAVLATGRKDI